MEKKDNSRHDAGWNDPPLFSYHTQTSQSKTKPRTLLNKRIAFPLNDASLSPSNVSSIDPTAPMAAINSINMPPPPSRTHLSSPEKLCESTETVELETPLEYDLDTVINNFNDIVENLFKNEEKNKLDVLRRIDAMKKMWLEDKLCNEIKLRLMNLSEALKLNELDRADDLQKSLMVDYGSVCCPWMSGIRFLIHQTPSAKD